MNYNLNKTKFKDRMLIKFVRGFHISMIFYYLPTALFSITGVLSNFPLWIKFNFYSVISILGVRAFSIKKCPITHWEYQFIKKRYKFKKLKLEGYYKYFCKKYFKFSLPHLIFDGIQVLILLFILVSYFIY